MINVAPADPRWAAQFDDFRERYEQALADVKVQAIEHVGSTAVPGLAAKPVIDVDIVVSRDVVAAATAAMEAIGYEQRGDLGIADRFALREPADSIRTNTYVVVAGSIALRNHLAVRDALRADPRLRDQYGALKFRLAGETDDIDVYMEGKSALIQGILERAGLSADERIAIADINRAP